ncbi:MAG TPA: SPOR domain-containing protein [Candidatus Binatia bacterium]|nr:SPOR domain-containing protein [Candidatus Binatia bacterium]
MRSSSGGPVRRLRRPLAPAALLAALLAALALGGCAHAPRRGEAAAPAEPDHEAPAPPTRRAELPPEPVPSERPAGAPARLDPSEQITPRELATLPDPVPRGGAQAPPAPAPDAPERPSGTPAPESVPGPSGGDSAAPAPSEGLWRVQIHASESRAEAERVGRAAARRLQAELVIQREGSLYKVRLGAFATEAEAQALRDRAARAGYPGAFRTRSSP